MTAYYNEFDPKAAAWLRELIKEGHIADGVVDERSIVGVNPEELHEYTQCHFFAGIGGWSRALRLASWPDDRPVWTGSCPCQPFSAAGKQMGRADPRHLWPAFRRLINRCRPPVVFGEQVASKAGRLWLAGVRANLETMGYAVRAADLCSAGVGSPNIRQRLYWMAHSEGPGWKRSKDTARQARGSESESDGSRVGYSISQRQQAPRDHRTPDQAFRTHEGQEAGATGGRVLGFWQKHQQVMCRDGKTRRTPVEPEFFPLAHGIPGRVGLLRGYGNAINPWVAKAFIEAYEEASVL